MFDLFNNLHKLRQDWLSTIKNDGGYCPCCDRWGKISPFTLTETHALSLKWFADAPCDDDGWILVPPIAPNWMLRGKNYSMMAKWNLIEHGGNSDTSKRSDGYWRITAKGLDFILGKIRVPKTAYIYANTVQAWSDELIAFADCFGKHFDYEYVMSSHFDVLAISDIPKGKK